MSIFKQQRENVRVSIQESAISLFRQKGYENVTIDEITKNVGIAKGTFYNFYSAKFDILLLWAEQEFGKVDFKAAMNSEKTISRNVDMLIKILVKAIQENEQLFRAFINEIFKVLGDGKFDFISIFKKLVTDSKDFKEIGGSLLDEKLLILNNVFFFGIVNWYSRQKSIEGLEVYLGKLKRICLSGSLANFDEGVVYE